LTEEGLDRETDFYGRQTTLHELVLNALTHGLLGAEMQAAERLQPFLSTLERLAGRWGSAGPSEGGLTS
jgi:hypothetical protein